jgi:flagellar biosynthetic protein FliO
MNEIAFFPSFLKILFALATVLGLMVGAMYLMRRYMNHPSSGNRDGSSIQVLSTRYIGPKCSILLVDVLGKGIVLGLSNGQMTLLTALDDGPALEKMRTIRQNEPASPYDVTDFLKRYTNKIKMLNGVQKGGRER